MVDSDVPRRASAVFELIARRARHHCHLANAVLVLLAHPDRGLACSMNRRSTRASRTRCCACAPPSRSLSPACHHVGELLGAMTSELLLHTI